MDYNYLLVLSFSFSLFFIWYIIYPTKGNDLKYINIREKNISYMLRRSVKLYNERITYINKNYKRVYNCKGFKNAIIILLIYAEIIPFIKRNYNFFQQKYYDKLIFYVTEKVNLEESYKNITYTVIDVSETFFQFPYKFNQSSFNPSWKKRGKWNYQHMCRFFFRDIFLHPSMCDVNMYMRLDSDSTIYSNENLFKLMNQNTIYMYNNIFNDAKGVVYNLDSFTKSYVREFNIDIKDTKSYKDLFYKTVLSYNNNFEICRIKFFRSKKMIQFTNLVDLSYEQFIYRWGDAPLRFISLSLFCNFSDKITLPKTVKYYHGT